MTAHNEIQALADSIGVDAGSVRWLADYIIRQTPEGHEDLLADPEWIKACTKEWAKMTRRMAGDALRKPEQAARVVADHL